MNLKIIFFGTPNFTVPVLEQLIDNFQVISVVTSPDRPVGRHQTLTPTPVAIFAQNSQIQVLKPEKLDNDVAQQLKKLHPDLFVVAAYGKIIPQNVLDIPQHGAVNIHPSLLPKYRGPSPIQSAILNGDQITGVTIMKMDNEIDHGPIITAKDIRLSEQDTFQSLSTSIFEIGAGLLTEMIPDFVSRKIEVVEQDNAIATYCNRVKKEDGYFNIGNPPSPVKLDRMIRAYYPWPTAWTCWNGKIVKLLPLSSHSGLDSPKLHRGELDPESTQYLVQIEGKKPVKLKDFLRGHSNFPLKSIS